MAAYEYDGDEAKAKQEEANVAEAKQEAVAATASSSVGSADDGVDALAPVAAGVDGHAPAGEGDYVVDSAVVRYTGSEAGGLVNGVFVAKAVAALEAFGFEGEEAVAAADPPLQPLPFRTFAISWTGMSPSLGRPTGRRPGHSWERRLVPWPQRRRRRRRRRPRT